MCQLKTRASGRKTLTALIVMLVATSAISAEQTSEETLMVADPFIHVFYTCSDETATLFKHPDLSWRSDTLFGQCPSPSSCMCEDSSLSCKRSVHICDALINDDDNCARKRTLLSSYDSPDAGYAGCPETGWQEGSPCCCNSFRSVCF